MTPLARALRKVFRQVVHDAGSVPSATGGMRGWVGAAREPEQNPADGNPQDGVGSPLVDASPQQSGELIRSWAGLVAPLVETESAEDSHDSSKLVRRDGPHTLRREDDVVWPPHCSQRLLNWPEICQRLHNSSEAGQALEGVARHLVGWRQQTGGQRVLMTGPGRKIGRTATLLALARAVLEHTDASVLLVDATLGSGDREAEERFRPQPDEQKIVETLPAVVTLVPERLWLASLARLAAPVQPVASNTDEPSSGGAPLLVLIDGGSWEELDRGTWLRPGVLDGVIDIRRFGDSTVDSQFEELRLAAGIPVVGTIETLAPQPAC